MPIIGEALKAVKNYNKPFDGKVGLKHKSHKF